MSEITGVITTHLAALGAATRDRKVFAILTRNPQFIEDLPVTGDDGTVWIEIANIVDGVLLRFRDGELDSVRTNARRHGDYYPYPTPRDLITGLDLSTATRGDVMALLGEPAGATERDAAKEASHLRYEAEGGTVTLTFRDDLLETVTVSRS
ncbi:hypothetical protein FNH13_01615 [Ornithinimicrobium ciconiae]|uniref:Uncharacterized protein n=1 Tax=Ornithinimicrobium ciconiae TaxID=2594265 RepID=A0A516G6L9_9MICO|nr:hypothetical protein [Ornithinimicrobium ciconiae]QDO87179.1 hypothetical protein FNH13_01615 [Ornithinimicrobium ciconiae]